MPADDALLFIDSKEHTVPNLTYKEIDRVQGRKPGAE
jgi:hypothetical protein